MGGRLAGKRWEARTTEPVIEVRSPKAPDSSIGKIFDHEWALLSPLIPKPLVRNALKHRFEEKVASEVAKNLSRLTSQWEGILRKAVREIQSEAEFRFDELVSMVQRLLTVSEPDSAEILRSSREEIASVLKSLEALHQGE